MENVIYDKVNGDVAFIDETHKYFNLKNPDIEYISVTTLIGKYHEEFDEDFWTSYKSLEFMMGQDFIKYKVKDNLLKLKKFNIKLLDDLDINKEIFLQKKQELIESYELNRKTACERGTCLHKIKEELFYKDDYHSVEKLLGKNQKFHCKKDDFNLDKEQAVYPEFLIYYHHIAEYLNIAGQVDLLIKDGNDIYIYDYKTNIKGINDKAFFDRSTKQTKKMFHPINNIEDTTLMHYTLQLSLYAYMLQELHPEFNICVLKLIHIDEFLNEKEIELEYKKDEIERLIKFQAKKSKTEYDRKRINFDFLNENAN